MDTLRPKQESFCLIYIETGNATEAYRKTYNCEKMLPATINRKAKECLDNGKITARIEELLADHRTAHEYKIDDAMRELELLFIIAVNATNEVGIIRGGIMAILGTLWIWIAGVILSECIGRTNWSPLSGMTLIAVTMLIIIAKGIDNDPAAIVTSVLVGAAACVAMSQATDLMMDLKTGYLVGAIPKKQQIAQLLATWLGPIVIMSLIFVLDKSYGLGSEKLPAPQGQALAGMIEGILGGDVPVQKYIAGGGLGILLSSCGIGGLGILVGLGFLPVVPHCYNIFDRYGYPDGCR